MTEPSNKIERASVDPNTIGEGFLAQYVNSVGGEVVKQDGRVAVRLSGTVTVGKIAVDYDLVPSQGVLAKAGKWRNMSPSAQLQLVQERVNAKVAFSLEAQVREFVSNFVVEAEQAELDPRPFLVSLSDGILSDPVEYVFEAVQQRLLHAIEKHQEESRDARAREVVSLGDYPRIFRLGSAASTSIHRFARTNELVENARSDGCSCSGKNRSLPRAITITCIGKL